MIFSTRDWAVHRTVDQMTDAPTCTGIYKHDWNFQLNADGFYISLRVEEEFKASPSDSATTLLVRCAYHPRWRRPFP